MKNKKMFIFLLSSIFMLGLLNPLNAEDAQKEEITKTVISFLDEEGNPLELDNTVSIGKFKDYEGTKVPVPVCIKDGKETEDYDNGEFLEELEIKDGILEIDGLTKDEEYFLAFDNDYVFKDSEEKYYMYSSFKGGEEVSVISNQIQQIKELTEETLNELKNFDEVMPFGLATIAISINCNHGGTFTVKANKIVSNGQTYEAINSSGTAGSQAAFVEKDLLSSGGRNVTISYSKSKNGNKTLTLFPSTGNKSYSCEDWGLKTPQCSSGQTQTCGNGVTVTQSYNANGGSCDRGSDTRTRYNGSRKCNTDLQWGSCSLGSWSGSVSAPNCWKGDTSEGATVRYDGNKGNGSTNVTLSKNSDSISRSVHWRFTGFSNFDANFTSNRTATANYEVSGRDGWPNVTLPNASRDGYTFVGWVNGGNTYQAGQSVNSNGNNSYTAKWTANDYEYTIRYVSSTGKVLKEFKETHKFDEDVTLRGEDIAGYVTPTKTVKWDTPNNNRVIDLTYDIITYKIDYSLEIGNRYPANNKTTQSNPLTYTVETPDIVLTNATRRGYTFTGWYSEDTFTNKVDVIELGSVGDKKLFAKFEANKYPLTVKNTNDRVAIDINVNGEKTTLNANEQKTWDVLFDSDFTVSSDKANPIYYTSDIRNTHKSKEYREEVLTANSFTTSMDEGHTVQVGATRNVKTFTATLKNDNGKTVSNTVKVEIFDNLTGRRMDETADEFAQSVKAGEPQKNVIEKTKSVNKNSATAITYTIPENTHLVVSAINNSIEKVGYDNSTTGKTNDYLTMVETPEMYSSDIKDIDRKDYKTELGKEYIVFTTFDNAKDEYKNDPRTELIIDNQYLKATYNFNSENSARFKLYECLTESCTVKYNVQNTEHDVNFNYFAQVITSEVSGESKELATLEGTSGSFKNVDRYKTYKIVQESLTKDRYYSWDSGYEIKANEFNGAGTGETTIALNKKSKMIKVETNGTTHEPMFGGSTITTGKGGCVITSYMKQPYTKVSVKATTGSGVPVAGVEMYFGANTDIKPANKNIYVAAPTTKTGIKFESGSASGKALQPDIDYTGYLGGSWITDLSGAYAPFNGYLAENSWYKSVSLPMTHYEEENQGATNFDLVIDTAKLTLKAKTDIGNLNAVFNVNVGNTTYNYGDDGKNGEMINSTSTIVMHLGENIDRCTGNEINKVCLDNNGYYSYTLDIPTDKLITVKNVNNNLYYDVKQTCDVDTDKYACRSFVSESVNDEHVQYFDFTRQKAVINVESILDNVKLDRSVINTVKLTIKDTQNVNSVCNIANADYCGVWNNETDWTKWNELNSTNATFKKEDGKAVYTFEMNPKTNQKATAQFTVPAGVEYEVSAKVKLENTEGWLSNFINGIYGLTGSNKYNSGYRTYVTDANGLAKKGEVNKVVLNTNDYQYARINIKSNTGAKFDIYDNTNTNINTVTFGDQGNKYVDIDFEKGPYTVKQNGSVAGYYAVKDNVVTVTEKDAIYNIDMSQNPIKFTLGVYGNLPEKEETPITNITYAIGEDKDNIIYTGILSETNQLFGEETKLVAGKTYKIFVGGNTVDGKVSDYYGQTTLTIPTNAPEKDLMAKVVIKFAPNSQTEPTNPDNPDNDSQFITRTITTNDVFGNLTNEYEMKLSKEWTYDVFNKGVYKDTILDGTSKKVYLPTFTIDKQEGMTYTFTVKETFGYKTTVTDEANYKVVNNKPATISIVNTPLNFTVIVNNTNSAYDDVPVQGIKYGIYDKGQLDANSNPTKIGEITTDENGQAKTTLEYGIDHDYFIKQEGSKFGYNDDTNEYKVKPTDPFIFETDVITVNVKQEAKTYKVNYTFLNKEFHETKVVGATYKLVDEITNNEIEYKTNEEGKISFTLSYGHDHYLEQIKVPYGYKLTNETHNIHMNEDYADFNFETDEINEIGYVVPENFNIKIHGTNSVFTDVKPEGVEYTMYNGSKCELKDRPEPKLTITEPVKPVETDYTDKKLYEKAMTEYAVKLAEYNDAVEVYDKAHKFWENNKQVKVCEIVGTKATDKNGEVIFNVTYGQDYYVEQTKTIFGYKPAKDENGDNTKWNINLIKKYPEFNFEKDFYDLEINLEPYKYTIVITKKDNSGNPVEGTEYTTYDKVTGKLPIEEAVKEPITTTDKNGKAEVEVTFGHDYTIIETKTPDGYEKPNACKVGEENCDKLEPTLPDDFDFKKDKEEIEDKPAKGHQIIIAVSGKDNRTNGKLETTFHLYDNQDKKDADKGKDVLTTTYSQKKTWTVKADTPYGYFGSKDQDVKVEFNKDGSIKKASMVFGFDPMKIAVNVINAVKGDKLILYTSWGQEVDSKKVERNNDVISFDSMVYGENYYVKVKHPYGYIADNNEYKVVREKGFENGLAWANDIVLKKAIWINTEKNRYGIEITVKDQDGEPVKGVKLGLYNKKGNLLKDSYEQEASATTDKEGKARIYVFEGVIGTIKQIEVPENYEINTEEKTYKVAKINLVKASEVVKDYIEIEYINTKTAEDNLAEENANKCENARLQIQQIKDSLKKSDYKSKDWKLIQAKIAEIEAEVEGIEGCNLDTNLNKNLMDYASKITELKEYIAQFNKRGHWMHIIVVAVSILAIIINVAFTNKAVNIATLIINLLVGIVISVFFDPCMISILATLLSLIINITITILHNRDDDDDEEPEEYDQIYLGE